MNKGRRSELTKLKYKKLLKLYGLKHGGWTALKSHGTPCSCGICKADKFRDNDRQKHKKIPDHQYD